GRPWMIFVASPSVTPGSVLSSAAVALLMSTIVAFGAAVLPRISELDAFGTAGAAGAMVEGGELLGGVVVVAGWAITGAAIVNAKSPIGSRINLIISHSCFEAASRRR